MLQNRTHTCNELRIEHAGQSVQLSGWMENVREVGQNLAFVILRDYYGTTQVVIENEEMMQSISSLHKETVIEVQGTVRERSSKNPNLPTGEIEVVPTSIKANVLHALYKEAGLDTPGQGIAFALPVDGVVGLAAPEKTDKPQK